MKHRIIELDNGTIAIIRSHSTEHKSHINAQIGFIRPGMRCLEYIHLKDGEPEYKGINEAVNNWLTKAYQQNINIIQQRLTSLQQQYRQSCESSILC